MVALQNVCVPDTVEELGFLDGNYAEFTNLAGSYTYIFYRQLEVSGRCGSFSKIDQNFPLVIRIGAKNGKKTD